MWCRHLNILEGENKSLSTGTLGTFLDIFLFKPMVVVPVNWVVSWDPNLAKIFRFLTNPNPQHCQYLRGIT